MSDVNKVRMHLPATSHVQATRRIASLEAELAQLREALASRQRIGVATGLVAERCRLNPEQAWGLLVHLSQQTNVKVRDIASLVVDGPATEEARALAARLNALMPRGGRPLVP